MSRAETALAEGKVKGSVIKRRESAHQVIQDGGICGLLPALTAPTHIDWAGGQAASLTWKQPKSMDSSPWRNLWCLGSLVSPLRCCFLMGQAPSER